MRKVGVEKEQGEIDEEGAEGGAGEDEERGGGVKTYDNSSNKRKEEVILPPLQHQSPSETVPVGETDGETRRIEAKPIVRLQSHQMKYN